MDTEANTIPPIVPRPGCQKLGFLVNGKGRQHTKSDLVIETARPETTRLFLLLLR